MTFRNSATATNQILGRVAGTQHHQWSTRNTNTPKSVFDKPLEFDAWLLKGMNHFYEKYGTEFDQICPGLMRIRPKNGTPFLRTLKDFEEEYEEYKINFYL